MKVLAQGVGVRGRKLRYVEDSAGWEASQTELAEIHLLAIHNSPSEQNLNGMTRSRSIMFLIIGLHTLNCDW
jgi:hypothetical protein